MKKVLRFPSVKSVIRGQIVQKRSVQTSILLAVDRHRDFIGPFEGRAVRGQVLLFRLELGDDRALRGFGFRVSPVLRSGTAEVEVPGWPFWPSPLGAERDGGGGSVDSTVNVPS